MVIQYIKNKRKSSPQKADNNAHLFIFFKRLSDSGRRSRSQPYVASSSASHHDYCMQKRIKFIRKIENNQTTRQYQYSCVAEILSDIRKGHKKGQGQFKVWKLKKSCHNDTVPVWSNIIIIRKKKEQEHADNNDNFSEDYLTFVVTIFCDSSALNTSSNEKVMANIKVFMHKYNVNANGIPILWEMDKPNWVRTVSHCKNYLWLVTKKKKHTQETQ